jgi:hypothetical protein
MCGCQIFFMIGCSILDQVTRSIYILLHNNIFFCPVTVRIIKLWGKNFEHECNLSRDFCLEYFCKTRTTIICNWQCAEWDFVKNCIPVCSSRLQRISNNDMGITFSVACNFVYKSVFVYFVLLLFKMSMLDQAHHSCFTKIFSTKITTQISFVLKVFSP